MKNLHGPLSMHEIIYSFPNPNGCTVEIGEGYRRETQI